MKCDVHTHNNKLLLIYLYALFCKNYTEPYTAIPKYTALMRCIHKLRHFLVFIRLMYLK